MPTDIDAGLRYSVSKFPGDGATVVYPISFAGGYISRAHVKAYLVDNVSGVQTDAPFTFADANSIVLAVAVPTTKTLVLYRDTPKNIPLADFTDGAVVTELNLDSNAKQAVFIAAESYDAAQDTAAVSSAALVAANLALAGAGTGTGVSVTSVKQALSISRVEDKSASDIMAGMTAADIETSLTYSPLNKAGDTMSGPIVLKGFSQSGGPNVPFTFVGDGSAALGGGVLAFTGASAVKNEICVNVTYDDAIATGGGKSYGVAGFFYAYGAAGSCTKYALNPTVRLAGNTPGTACEANTDNLGSHSGDGDTQNSVWSVIGWKTLYNAIAGGTGRLLAGMVITCAGGAGKLLNRGLLFDGDSVLMNDIETTTNADTAYMVRGAKRVGIDMTNASFSSFMALALNASQFIYWKVGGTLQAVLGVSGTVFQMGFGVTKTLVGSVFSPAIDNTFSSGEVSLRWSQVNTVQAKTVLHILDATTAPTTPVSGTAYLYFDGTSVSVKLPTGVTKVLAP